MTSSAVQKWLKGERPVYALKYDGKVIQRSHYVDELFWTGVDLVQNQGYQQDKISIIDELSSDQVITEDVEAFCTDLNSLRRR